MTNDKEATLLLSFVICHPGDLRAMQAGSFSDQAEAAINHLGGFGYVGCRMR